MVELELDKVKVIDTNPDQRIFSPPARRQNDDRPQQRRNTISARYQPRPARDRCPLSAAKGGIKMLTCSMAAEWARSLHYRPTPLDPLPF